MGNVNFAELNEDQILKTVQHNKTCVKWHTKHFTAYYDTVLLYACAYRYEKLALLVIDKYVELENKQSDDEKIKFSHGKKKIKTKNYLGLLGHVNNSINSRNSRYTALLSACINNLPAVVAKLLQYPEYSNVNFVYNDVKNSWYNGLTALHMFIMYNKTNENTEILYKLLELTSKENVHTVIKINITGCAEEDNILTYYVERTGWLSAKIIGKIIDLDVDVNYQNRSKKTFLMIAFDRFKDMSDILVYLLSLKKFTDNYKWEQNILVKATKHSYRAYKILSDYYKKNSIVGPALAELFNCAYEAKNVSVIKDLISDGYVLTDRDCMKLKNEPIFFDIIKDNSKAKDIDPEISMHFYVDKKFELLFKRLDDIDSKLTYIESRVQRI